VGENGVLFLLSEYRLTKVQTIVCARLTDAKSTNIAAIDVNERLTFFVTHNTQRPLKGSRQLLRAVDNFAVPTTPRTPNP
jgi:hypothetical protein